MPNTNIAGGILQGANTAFGFGTGLSQFLKAKQIQKQLDAQGRPILQIPDAFKEYEALVKSQYLDPTFSGQSAIANTINSNTANQLANINDTASNGSQALAASLVANQNANKQLSNLGIEAADRQAKDQSQLYDTLGKKAELQNAQFDFNVVQPYTQAGLQAQALKQAGLTNIDNSMKDAAAYAAAIGRGANTEQSATNRSNTNTTGISYGVSGQNAESLSKLAEVGLLTPSLIASENPNLVKNMIGNGGKVNVEGGETILDKNGNVTTIKGDIHEYGGENIPLTGNESAIFSNKIGYNSKGEIELNQRNVSSSFAEESKKIYSDKSLTKEGKKLALEKLKQDADKAQQQILRGYAKGKGMSKAMFGMNFGADGKSLGNASKKKDQWGNFIDSTSGLQGQGGYVGDGTSVDSQTQQQLNQATGVLNNIPIVGQFKAIGDGLEQIGGQIGGEYGSNVVQGFTNPLGRQIEVFKNDKDYSRGQKILAALFPFASGFIKPHKDKVNLVTNSNSKINTTLVPSKNYLTQSYS